MMNSTSHPPPIPPSGPPAAAPPRTLLGHPTGLFALFFAEMWERFSYYGMRALLVFYMIKGFLGYGDDQAYGVYGAYTALVYATPFIGGMLADRLLGQRRAVVLGGLLMAAGHLAMTVEHETVFFMALALLILGNGFFKPNISTIVGGLYPKESGKKDTGFTIFYMGINLGAAMSPILCGYVGETYGWHYGFGLATVGMLVGVAVFVAPTRLTQILILGGALLTACTMPWLQDSWLQFGVRICMSVALTTAGIIAFVALRRGGLPKAVGAAPSEARLAEPALATLRDHWVLYYLGIMAAFLSVQYLATPSAVESWMITAVTLAAIAGPWLAAEHAVYVGVAAAIPAIVLLVQRNEVAGVLLLGFGLLAFGSIIWQAVEASRVERERMFVVLILMIFSMLFWAFFEQAGSSVNNFTDRNIDRVFEARTIHADDVGSTLTFRLSPKPGPNDTRLYQLPLLTQEQLGKPCAAGLLARVDRATARQQARRRHGAESEREPAPQRRRAQAGAAPRTEAERQPGTSRPDRTTGSVTGAGKGVRADGADPRIEDGDRVFTMTHLAILRDEAARPAAADEDKTISWPITAAHVGMGIGGAEIPASEFQAANPIFILVFGLVFSAVWGLLGTRGLEPGTAVKFALGLLQLGLAFGAFWYGARWADHRGMVGMQWLLFGYLLQTTGELCLSPVGLAMVTKLSPARMVSTVMGAWFLATAFSNYLAGMIAKFTGVGSETGASQVIPPPAETVDLYGNVFGTIAVAAIGSAAICFCLAPRLDRWTHVGADADGTVDERHFKA